MGNGALKELPPSGAYYQYNYEIEVFPDLVKDVIMVSKPGKDKSLPGNHWHISLLSNVAKQIILRDEIFELASNPGRVCK